MARRLPPWVNSDHLSVLGLLGMAAAGACFAAVQITPWAAAGAVAALAVNWFGDSLDGTLARVRDRQRPRYGFYVDHVIDIAGTTMLFAGMACSGLMSPLLALAVLATYLLVAAEAYLATHAAGVFRLSFMGIGPTELRLILAVGVIRAARNPWISVPVLGQARLLFDVGGVAGLAALGAVFVVSSIRNTVALYRADRVPERPLRADGSNHNPGGLEALSQRPGKV
jgi:phosphatidylglycerophosphate synthase